MRIQVVSDLHHEFFTRRWPGELNITPAVGADVLVLAGDIALGASAIELFKDWPVPVLYVCGNHEFYARTWPDVLEAVRSEAQGTRIHVLERDSIELDGVRFLGTTLWTDYLLSGVNLQPYLMRRAKAGISDHKHIATQGGHLFRPVDALADHQRSRAWLEEQLALPFDGKTVVISHHGPHPGSIHQQFVGSDLNAAFVSDLPALVGQADVWIHGHVHNSFDYEVDGCRIVVNPQGYPLNAGTAETAKHIMFENPEFNSQLTIEI
nr:metallophosphoesterase family protein [uncultured Albidiferax sp.]